MPKPLTSDFNTMVVRFKSDHTLTSQGFKATYSKLIQTTVAPAPATTATTKPTTDIPTTNGKQHIYTSLPIFLRFLFLSMIQYCCNKILALCLAASSKKQSISASSPNIQSCLGTTSARKKHQAWVVARGDRRGTSVMSMKSQCP